jgi:hypothetical protein
MRDRVTIAGALAQRPGVGGHAAVFVQWLLGFRRLGWDVLFVDRLEPALDAEVQHRWLAAVLDGAGLAGCWAALTPSGDTVGLSRADVVGHVRTSALLVNVMGHLDDAELLAAARRRVFLDIDPGFPQMWQTLGLHDAFAGHDDFVTVGVRLGQPGSGVPDCGLRWIPTLPPVDVESWPAARPTGDGAFTSVATWRGPFGPIDFGGRRYGLRVHEFRRFLDLPVRSGARFEVALHIDAADYRDRQALVAAGWHVADPHEVARDIDAYRAYVTASSAEFAVAKNLYVDTRCGWFSDRSACYLAAGRPVLAQDTGFGDALPVGDGLLAFSSLEDAVAGVEDIVARSDHHAAAAREVAEAHLDAPKVVGALLGELEG